MPEPEMTDDQKRAKIQELYEKLSAKGYFQTAEGKQAAQTLADAGIITARRIDRTKPLSQYDTAVQRFPDMPEGLRGGGGDKVLKSTPSPKQAVAQALAKRQAEARREGIPIPRKSVSDVARSLPPLAPPDSMRRTEPTAEPGILTRPRQEAFRRIVPSAMVAQGVGPTLLGTAGAGLGGVAGAMAGGMAGGALNLPIMEETFKALYGDRGPQMMAQYLQQQEAYRQNKPVQSQVLEALPQLAAQNPLGVAKSLAARLPGVARAAERSGIAGDVARGIVSNAPMSAKQALGMAAVGGAMGGGTEAAMQGANVMFNDGQWDLARIGQQAGLGALLSGPNTKLGDAIEGIGRLGQGGATEAALTRRVQQQRAFERTADAFAPKPANQFEPHPRPFEPPVIPAESRPIVDTRPVVGGEQQPTVESVVAPVAKRKGKTGTAEQPVPEVSPVENASKTAPIVENIAETPISPTEKPSKPDFFGIFKEWTAHKDAVMESGDTTKYKSLTQHLDDSIGIKNTTKFINDIGPDTFRKLWKGDELTTPEKAKIEDTWDSIFEAPAPADSSTAATTSVETAAETPIVKPPVEQPVVPPADVTEPPSPTLVQAEAAKAEVDSSVADAPTTFAPPTRRKKPSPHPAEPPAEPPTNKAPTDRVTPGPEAWFMSHAYLERTAKDLGYEISSPYEQTKLANEMYKAVHASATDAEGNSYNPHEWEVENLLQTGIDAKRTISEDERIVAAMMLEKARAEYNLLSLKENPTPQEIAEANGLFDRMRRLATIVHLGGSQAGRSLVVQKSLLGEADSLMSMIGQLDRVTEGGLRDEKGNLTTRGEEVVGELRQQYDALVKAKAESEAALMARAQEAEAQLARLQEIAKKNKATGKAQGGTGEMAAATSGKSEGKVIAKSRDGKIEIYEHELVDRSELEGAMARIRKSKEEPEVQAKKKENGC